MDFQLSDEQRALVEGASRLARQLEPRAKAAREAEEHGDFAPLDALRREMAANGLLGLNMPQAHGGMGLPLLDTLLLIQALQKVDATLGGLAHRTSTGAIGAILELGDDAQKAHFVGGVARGEFGISIGITEPEAGSAATAMTTRARIDGDTVVLNGQKIFISAAKAHRYTMLYCRFGTSGSARDIGAIVVPHDAPGFTIGGGSLNMAGERQYELFFDDCRVPRANVLAEANAFGRLISVYNAERLGSMARMIGSAQASFEFALGYVQERRQFGRPLADFQGLQWILAEMKVKLEAAQLMLWRAGANAGAGLPAPVETSMAKVYVAQACKEVCDDAIQLLGGYGYMTEYPVEGRYREVRGGSIYGGTLQIHKNMIAAHLLGRKNNQWAPKAES